MSNEKISMLDLSESISEATDIAKKNVTAFLKEFQQVLIDGLDSDKQVKINGLGTFKLQWVAARKSVNVRTREEMEIPGHYKIVFLPELALKQIINGEQQLALQSEMLDPIEKMAEQASEIKGILSEINTESPTTKEEVKKTENVGAEEKPEVAPSASVRAEPSRHAEPVETKKYTWLIWLTAACFVVMMLGIAYYFYSEEVDGFFGNDRKQSNIVVEQIKKEDSVLSGSEKEALADEPIDYSQTLAEETMAEGTRLAFFATKYYGHPDFWVYIYEPNKEKIPNPSSVLIGTKIRIPKMKPELVDAKNPEAVSKAVQLGQIYIQKRAGD